MSQKLHPYLLARLIAVQEAFNNPAYRMFSSTKRSVAPTPPPAKASAWDQIIKAADKDDDEQGGGGGTMKGFRGKQAEMAKSAMRRLGRK